MKFLAPALVIAALVAMSVAGQAPQERLCDTSFEDCRQPLWNLIDAETVGIDVSYWFMQDTSLSNKIIARFQAGVPVRILVDPRANPSYPGNEAILNQFAAAGIPMRYKVNDCILHRKFMLFVGQNQVEFSGANYSPSFFVPTSPFQDYIDEAIYFTSQASIVNSFKTIMDDMWTDTTGFGNYANVTGTTTRLYPTFQIDPELNFPPTADGSQDYYTRTAFNINHENQKIDIIMYRITNDRFTAVTNAAVQRGVPVRLITEQDEYRNRDRPWDSYNVDLMYNAGVQIRIRGHQGLNHQKTVVLYGLGISIFGSSNWTGPSSNCQQENNYFTTKPSFLTFFSNQFDRKWNSAETQPFTPLPPDVPVYQSPANNATGIPVNNTKLQWEGNTWAQRFDIYFGTVSNPPLIAADQAIGSVDNGAIPETYTLPALAPGTKYFWKIVSKTMANQTATGPVWSFTTAGSANPAPTVTSVTPASGTTAGGTSLTIAGTNFQTGASVSIGGSPATNVNVAGSTSIAAVTPAHAAGLVSVTVTNPDNQSATLSNSFTYAGSPPPPSGDVVLYAGQATVKAGSWNPIQDATAAGGVRMSNPDIGIPKLTDALANPSTYFEMTFNAMSATAYRLWIRGKAQVDSPYNDSIFVQFSDSTDNQGAATFRIGTTSSTVINLEDCSGCGLAGWGWQDNGWGVGVFGETIFFASSGTHTLRIQPREDGLSIDQIVLSPSTYLNTSPGALKNDTTILPQSGGGGGGNPAPTISSISPNSGTTAGGTSVTISGTNFVSGATVRMGGVSANNINVTSGTTITAVTPAHSAGAVDVVVTNADSQSAVLAGGFTYTNASNPPPTISGVSPATGPTTGGTSVQITGTNFATGATVSFGGTAASNVNVINSTSISAVTSAHAVGAVNVVVSNTDSGVGSAANAFTYTQSGGGETVLLADDFNDNSLDTTKWSTNLYSGFTDTSLPIAEINSRFEIGPLQQNASGSHYAGLRSVTAFNFTNAYCYVQVVQAAASSTAADAMLTVGVDVNGYYRIYVEGGSIIFQKRVNGSKATLLTATYNPTNDKYWRIRHDSSSGNLVFETAPDNAGSPGTWTSRFSEAWNTSAIPLTSILLEIKGGTWQPESNAPGKVIFDSFRAAKP